MRCYLAWRQKAETTANHFYKSEEINKLSTQQNGQSGRRLWRPNATRKTNLKTVKKKSFSKSKKLGEPEKSEWVPASFFKTVLSGLVASVPFTELGNTERRELNEASFISGQKSRYTFLPLPLTNLSSLR